MSSVVLGVALAAVASVLFNLAIVIQAQEARETPQEREHGLQLSLIVRLLRRPRWLLGTALGLLAFPLQTVALLFAPLTAVQPADAAGLLVLLFLGTRILHEKVGRREIAAVVAIVTGIVILTIAAPKREVTQVDGASVLLPLLAVAIVGLAPLLLRRWIGASSILVVAGAGFAFALSAFCAKIVADALDRGSWPPLLLGVGLAGPAGAPRPPSGQTPPPRRPAPPGAPVPFAIEVPRPGGPPGVGV